MFIPTESALKNSVVFCPCGEITKVGNDLLNQATSRRIHSHLAKETGRLYRPSSKGGNGRYSSPSQGVAKQRTIEFDFVPLV
jgi:hypothetical protein